jgi:RimJ/RimL family protein N-acetyltransferase
MSRQTDQVGATGRWANPTLVGALVTLRPYSPNDVEAVWEMLSDPEGRDLTATTHTFERSQIKQWCGDRNVQDERIDLVIVENLTGLFAGEVVLNEHDAASDSANFRISLRGPAWFGRGLGGEATQMIVNYGLDVIGLQAIALEVLARNERARRTYATAGFRTTDEFTESGESWIAMAVGRTARQADSHRSIGYAP